MVVPEKKSETLARVPAIVFRHACVRTFYPRVRFKAACGAMLFDTALRTVMGLCDKPAAMTFPRSTASPPRR